MGEFETSLPAEIRSRSRAYGNELAIPYPDVLPAIEFATQISVAVLGVEAFTQEFGSLQPQGYSGYEFSMTDWAVFVEENNRAAAVYIQALANCERFVYLLTTTSQAEFQALQILRDK